MHRLRTAEDPEALHDFRVALRRLRSSIKAYRPFLKTSINKSLARRLKQLASSTNPARDHEVMVARLTAEADTESEEARAGMDYVVQHLDVPATLDGGMLVDRFEQLRKRLDRRLRRFEHRLGDDDHPDFRAVSSEIIDQARERLLAAITRAEAIEDAAALHTIRIAAKRLRYLIEPWRNEEKDAKRIVRRLKSLQDILGDLQDTHVLLLNVAGCLETAAIEQARRAQQAALSAVDESLQVSPSESDLDTSKALVALIQHIKEARVRQFEIYRRWCDKTASKLDDELTTLVRDLKPSQQTVVRRWLINTMPDFTEPSAIVRLEEGYLPWSDFKESVRCIKEGRRVRYERWRQATTAFPVNETSDLTRKEFVLFWPLTEGRRLEWRVHTPSEPANWTIRECVSSSGETLIFAETAEAKPSMDWLEPMHPQEVTELARYQAGSLTRRSAVRNATRSR